MTAGMEAAAGKATTSRKRSAQLRLSRSTRLRKAGEAGCQELEVEIDEDRFMGLRVGLVELDSGIHVTVDVGASGSAKDKIKATSK